eukprot:11095047-Alexandrium_andersonii.AAC.1
MREQTPTARPPCARDACIHATTPGLTCTGTDLIVATTRGGAPCARTLPCPARLVELPALADLPR